MESSTLGQLMYLLQQEDKYSSKLYRYLIDNEVEPEECEVADVDLSELNKAEFGMLKQVSFNDFLLRENIEIEKTLRNGR